MSVKQNWGRDMPTFGTGTVSCNLEANICDLVKASSAGSGIDGEWFAILLFINEFKQVFNNKKIITYEYIRDLYHISSKRGIYLR
jgi:hypothetical protein